MIRFHVLFPILLQIILGYVYLAVAVYYLIHLVVRLIGKFLLEMLKL
ncbi:MAG: hypothetical protein ACW96X_08990 [Promethearchaeota archaeon]